MAGSANRACLRRADGPFYKAAARGAEPGDARYWVVHPLFFVCCYAGLACGGLPALSTSNCSGKHPKHYESSKGPLSTKTLYLCWEMPSYFCVPIS